MADEGSWGFKGFGARALELPSGQDVEVSPVDRGRLRYNATTSQLEFSANGGAYAALGMGGASPWLSAAGVTRLQNIADDVAIGATTMAGTEKLRVIGDVRVESQVQVTEITSVPGSALDLEISADTGNVNMTLTGGSGLRAQDGIGNPLIRAVPTGQVILGDAATPLAGVDITADITLIEGDELDLRASGSTDNLIRVETTTNTFNVGQLAPLLEANQINVGTQVLNAASSPNAFQVVRGGNDFLNIDTAGGVIQIGSTGGTGSTLTLDGTTGSTTLNSELNQAASFVLTDGTDDAIIFDATTGSKNLSLGGPNIEVVVPGNNNIRIDGGSLCIVERVADPAAVANEGKVYTKDVAGVTELFYRDSAGNVRQLTPPASGGAPGGANTNVQFNDAGNFGGNANFTFDGTNVAIATQLSVPVVQGTGATLAVGNGASDLTLQGVPGSGTLFSLSGTNPYLTIDDNTNDIVVGNTTDNPDLEFAGSGNIALTGGSQILFTERVGDPAPAANVGQIYTKDVAGQTELFYIDAAGNVRQLTPPATGAPGGANTNVQFNNAGSFDGNGNFTFDGTNVTIATRVDVPTIQGTAGSLELGNGVSDITVTATPASATAITIGTSNTYISVDDAAGRMFLGNALSNPALEIAGSGDIAITGGTQLVVTERVGDPGATANTGKLYTKDSAGTTELFYQDSAGNVRQLTPPAAGGTPSAPVNSVQFNNAGSFGGSADFQFDGTEINLGPPTGVSAILVDNNIATNTVGAFRIREDNNNYLRCDTGNTVEEMVFGNNAASTPAYTFNIKTASPSAVRMTDTAGRDYFNITTTGNRIEIGNVTLAPRVDIIGVNGGLYLRGDNLNNGSFLDIRQRLVGAPATAADRGQLWTQDVAGLPELFYQDDAGNVSQLTSAGGAVGGSTIVINDNQTQAFSVREAANSYIDVNTTNGAEAITWGNGNTDPSFFFAGAPGPIDIDVSPATPTASVNMWTANAGSLTIGNTAGGGPTTMLSTTGFLFETTGTVAFDVTAAATGNSVNLFTGNAGNVSIGVSGLQTQVSSNFRANENAVIAGTTTDTVGFYGATGIARPTITGSRGGNVALANLLTQLDNMGLIQNSTTP